MTLTAEPVHVAIAILHQEGRFLMQLRDDNPKILYPAHWAFFGGHLDPGETPDFAMKRELLEEIGYEPPTISKFGVYADEKVVRHVYQAPLTVPVADLILGEGWDLDLLSPEDIRRGDRYSERAARVCPLGPPHQDILLDFLAQHSL